MGRSSSQLRLAAAFLLGLAGLPGSPAPAQDQNPNQGLVVRDGTLGREPAGGVGPGVDPEGQWADYLIPPELGEQRGPNLFHSFWAFGIGAGETATFTGPDPIEGPQSVANVISRVTGGEASQIDGRLRSTIPGAAVWLLNPSGVVFGEGARLDVPGSFHAGTGDYVGFEGGLERFYGDPSLPSVLATAPPAAFGFLPGGGASSLSVDRSQLEVDPGESLELVGGDLSLTGAALRAPGGHVGLEAPGEIDLSRSVVDVGRESDAPGTISIRGGQIVIQEDSKVLAENGGSGPGARIDVAASEALRVDASLLSVNTSSAGNAGTIRMRGGEIALRNGPGLIDVDTFGRPILTLPRQNEVGARAETTGSGAAGTIEITAGSLVEIRDGAGLSAQTVGAVGEGTAAADASGQGGTVRIAGADSVRVEDRGFVSVDSWASRGDAGAIEIENVGDLTVDGNVGDLTVEGNRLTTLTASSLGSTSRLAPPPEPASGNAGRITITDAGPVRVRNGGVIQSDCFDCASGKRAGSVRIEAESLHVEGVGTGLVPLNPRKGFAIGSKVSAFALAGAGDAGSVDIDLTGSLELLRGAVVGVFTVDGASGRAGRVSVRADDVTIDVMDGVRGTGIFAQSGFYVKEGEPTTGDAGAIEIEARSLKLTSGTGPGGAFITAYTAGNGAGGDVTIDVEGGVEILGRAQVRVDNLKCDGCTAGLGNAGSIILSADSFEIRYVAGAGANPIVDAGTEGAGDAGSIILDADSVTIGPGGAVDAGTEGAGDGGSVTVRAGSVEIGPGQSAVINAGTGGSLGATGRAGTVDVEASRSILLTNEGGEQIPLEQALKKGLFTGIFSATSGGEAGSIHLKAPEITVTDGALVATSTLSGGQGGSILLEGRQILVQDGGGVDSTSLPDPRLPGAEPGDAGDVTLEATESIVIRGQHPEFGVGRVASLSLGSGAAGEVKLQAPRIVIDAGAVATTAVPSAQQREGTGGGRITLDAGRELLVTNGGRVDASTFIAGPGGSIDVSAGQSIRVQGEGSGIASRTGGSGAGESVALTAPRIDVGQGGEVSAESAPGFGALDALFTTGIVAGLIGTVTDDPAEVTGGAGSLELTTSDTLRIAGGRIATNAAAPDPGGADAGNITIRARRLVHLRDAGRITASVGGGQGGNIAIDPDLVILEPGSRIDASAGDGSGGRIQITTDSFLAFPGSVVNASAGDPALSGTVEIKSPDVNLAGTLAPLPSTFLDAASLMRERCAARRSGERAGSFAVRGPGGIPPEPDGWLPAPLLPEAATSAAAPAPPVLLASLSTPLLAAGACP